ncbi:uncharacterized protein LOC116128447 [Pistacia vera]|uniref:uncharacterized protein LOC116128447 n=1 Tax=Pistacia vera TaxID=55513 RepID=UPI001262BAE7|nr:uncharacterized protein LOC116128447 [Pistacia vera]
MLRSRNQVQFTLLLLFLLSMSFLGHEALAGRYLQAADTQKNKPQIWDKSTSSSSKNNTVDDDDSSFVATINREVPSCPDPLHNRKIMINVRRFKFIIYIKISRSESWFIYESSLY